MTTTPTIHIAQHQANLTDAGDQAVSSIIDIGMGRYVVVWTEEEDDGPIAPEEGLDLVGQIFDAAGNRIGNEFRVNNQTDADETDAALVARIGGGFITVYEQTDINGTRICVVSTDVNGDSEGSNPDTIQADTDADRLANPAVAMRPDGSYLVVYDRDRVTTDGFTDIVGKIVDADGGTVGPELDIANSADEASNADIAVLTNGNYVVVFQSADDATLADFDPQFGIFNSAGGLVTGAKIDAGANMQDDVQVAALTGGGFVAVWTEDNVDGDRNGIRARIYNNAGTAATGPFTVNLSTAGNQNRPDVVALRDGGFVVVWDNNDLDLEQGRRFDALGNGVGAEFTAGDVGLSGGEATPAIAALADGRFGVVFHHVTSDDDVYATIFDPYGPRTSDFNKDVRSDLLWRHDGGDIGTWHMNGAQVISTQAFANAPNAWHLEDTGDFNGDARSDLLWRHDDGTVGTWHMNGAQVISTQAFANAPNDWHIQGVADFNGDGKSDLLWRHNDGTVGTWHMNGATTISTQAFANAPPQWHIQGTGDFNGDGRDDILWRHDNGAVGTWHMNGAVQVSTQAFANQPLDWHIEGTGDFNGDGKDDILWRQDGGTVGIWLMNGAQILGGPTFGGTGNDWQIEGTGDFNGDGKDDIIWRHDNGTVATWHMNGAQILSTQSFGTQPPDWQLVGMQYDYL